MLAIASLGAAVAFIDATIVNIAFPDIARSFPGAPLSTLSWVLNAYNVVFAALLMAAAWTADLLGRRRVFIFGLQLFTAGSLLCALAPSADALIAFRVIQALGAACLVPSALALVPRAFPPARRAHGVALLSAVGAAAAGLGPSLGGLLAALAIGALVLGIVQGQDWGWGSAPVIGALAAALASCAAVIWRCTWHRAPVLDLSLLKIRAAAAAPGDSFATATGMNSVARQAGAAIGVAAVAAIIGTPAPAAAPAAFHHAWIFGAACLLAAGLGCLLIGRVKTAEIPAPAPAPSDAARGDAARAALVETESQRAVRSPHPRPRRMIALDTGVPAALHAESAPEFLARTPLFSSIDPELVEQLAAKSRTRRLAAGKWLFRERDPGDEMYVVRAGRLEVVDEAAGVVIREYRRGDALGEFALLTDSPRSASVRAARDTEIIAVDQADFTGLLYRSPALSWALNRSLSRRLQDTRASASTARPRPATAALIALDAMIPLPRLAAQLGAALDAHLPAAMLDGTEVPGRAVSGEPAGVYGPLLDRAEAGHDLVLLAGGPALHHPWTKFCLQQADRILAVTAGGPVPPQLGHHPELHGCDLVAYDPAPGDLDGWAAALDPAGSHLSMLHRTFGARLIEELPRSFMCGSAELRTGRLEIARHGPLWEAVGLSINLPIIAPPQVRGREMFIDGSLVDNLPVQALADMGEGPIIAVDVKATLERSANRPRAARAQDDRPSRPPSLGETLTRLLLLGSQNTGVAARRHADLVITPRARGIRLLEFDQLDAAREAGRAAAGEALERVPARLVA